MSTELFYPPVHYVPTLTLKAPLSLSQLCERAGVACKATGRWTTRQIELTRGPDTRLVAEPGEWGSVIINLPQLGGTDRARAALAALAFGMHDIVAKESIRSADWLRVGPPRGRPRSGRALSTKERQRRFRERRKAH